MSHKKVNGSLFSIILICCLLFSVSRVSAETQVYSNQEEAYQAGLETLPDKIGSYPISLKYVEAGIVVETVVYATVYGEQTKLKGNLAIDAQDFAINKQEVADLKMDDWVKRSQAVAWRTDTGESVSILSVDAGKIQAQEGTYPLTIKTLDQLGVTVQVTVNGAANSVFQNIFEIYYSEANSADSSWKNFERFLYLTINLVLIILLAIPLFILIFQYKIASKIMRQVMRLIIK